MNLLAFGKYSFTGGEIVLGITDYLESINENSYY